MGDDDQVAPGRAHHRHAHIVSRGLAMKSFDLTFNGGVLPDHDPGQVRRELARLFEIDDSALLERMFSGQTIILRHNLDRKAAADYFRKITLLGGQASLVKSPKYRSVQGDDLLVLESTLSRVPDPDPDPGPEPEPLPADAPLEFPPELAPEPPLEPVVDRGTTESSRREALGRAREASQKKEARLLRQKEQHDRIALEEIERIERLQDDKRASLEQEIAGLRALEDAQAETLIARLSDIENKKRDCEERARQTMAQLDDLMATTRQEDAEVSDLLAQRLESTRESSLEEIRRLEQQIEVVQLRAEAEQADLEQQLAKLRARSEAALEALQGRKTDAQRGKDAEIDALEQEIRATRQLSENRNAELRQQAQQLRERGKEESRKLEAMKKDIELRREAGLAGVAKELMQLREKTHGILQQLDTAGMDAGDAPDLESSLRKTV